MYGYLLIRRLSCLQHHFEIRISASPAGKNQKKRRPNASVDIICLELGYCLPYCWSCSMCAAVSQPSRRFHLQALEHLHLPAFKLDLPAPSLQDSSHFSKFGKQRRLFPSLPTHSLLDLLYWCHPSIVLLTQSIEVHYHALNASASYTMNLTERIELVERTHHIRFAPRKQPERPAAEAETDQQQLLTEVAHVELPLQHPAEHRPAVDPDAPQKFLTHDAGPRAYTEHAFDASRFQIGEPLDEDAEFCPWGVIQGYPYNFVGRTNRPHVRCVCFLLTEAGC